MFTRLLRRAWTVACSWYARRSCGSYQTPPVANGWTRLTRATSLGRNVHFNGLVIQGRGRVSIGDNFHSAAGCLILTEFHKYDGGNAIPYDTHATVCKDVNIEDNVWLGARVIILGGVRIGEGAIIQAGAVVVGDIPAFGIAGGNPAKVFKERDRAAYLRLKSEGRFC
jgi:chloramphenicol O-acetyltransferase type B